ncbi:MAG: hypothetical protein Q9195_003314 [Heterodermia aff. obscurata]
MAGAPSLYYASKPGSNKLCKFFLKSGGCRYGKSCKFSHAADEPSPAKSSSSRASPRASPQSDLDDNLRKWRNLLPRTKSLSTFEPRDNDTRNFFSLGWTLVATEGDSAAQYVVTELATERGLRMVKASIDRLESCLHGPELEKTFMEMVLPLFRILTHQNVQSSLLLETPLNVILNWFFGPNGQRLIAIFQSTAEGLIYLQSEDSVSTSGGLPEALTATLLLLYTICELHHKAQVLEELPAIVEILADCVPADHLYHGARQTLARIRRRLGLGADIPIVPVQSAALAKTVTPAKFKFRHELPGNLSDQGPRHDNDHVNIQDIKVLPTAEEIHSSRQEYLPSNDPEESHLPGLEGLLDRQFRLLREDQIGPLRDAVRLEVDKLSNASPTRAKDQAARTIGHPNAVLCGWEIDRRKGLQIHLEFDQPSNVKAKEEVKQREKIWNESKQLQFDALVCLVSATGRTIFFTVCDPTPTPPRPKRENTDHTDDDTETDEVERDIEEYIRRKENVPSLHLNRDRAAIALTMAQYDEEDVEWVNEQLRRFPQINQSLVVFPGVLLPSFGPVLEALKVMSKKLDLPFAEWIAPDDPKSAISVLEAPTYARYPYFGYNLSTVASGSKFVFRPGEHFDHEALQAETTLDPAQQASVLHALSSELALIQGPPGTGKSYTGSSLVRILLNSCQDIESGPILIVCYTNHALDQFLESLVESKVEQIIRIGRRSQSKVLEKCALHHLTREMEQTKVEGQERWTLRTTFEAEISRLRRILPLVNNITSATNVRNYLEKIHPEHYAELYKAVVDEEGFQQVRMKESDPLRSWLNSRDTGKGMGSPLPRPASQLTNSPLRSMTATERQILYQHWITEYAEDLNSQLLSTLESYEKAKVAQDKCNRERDLRCLRQAHVIGCTTTGLAKNLEVLRKINSKVVLVEEAGEVLEAHTLTALLPSVEHAILIGDHEQLRPQINSHDLQHDHPHGERYALDLSLFERFVKPKYGAPELPFSSLKTQRRMHPSISELIRSTLYPQLEDHQSVSNYPEVCGMRDRLYWLDHNEQEDKATPGATASFSKSNAFEVELIAAIVSHLTRQGEYSTEDIAVLTPYLGQLRAIKQRLGSTFEIVIGDKDDEDMLAHGIKDDMNATQITQARKSTLLKALRLSTVDNFQGEEAKIVIISLVRSNDERKCGFLKTSNRINVLLSRARHGMYIIGNSYTASSVKMWDDVVRILKDNERIGTRLALCCPRHPNTQIKVRTPDDFAVMSPEGENAKTATSSKTESSYRFPTGNVLQYAVGTTLLVIILARKRVMMGNSVHYARSLAKFSVLTLDATRAAQSRAHPVPRIALGLVHIVENVGWPAQCLVIYYPALDDARRY